MLLSKLGRIPHGNIQDCQSTIRSREVGWLTEKTQALIKNSVMKSRRFYLHLPICILGIFILTACSKVTAEPSQPVDEKQETQETNTSVPATEVPIVEDTRSLDKTVQEISEYEIITLLPKDAIPSIDDPEFYNVAQADQEYTPEEFVIGVEFNGEAKAYSVPLLSRREIVNDRVNGKPIAVTW